MRASRLRYWVAAAVLAVTLGAKAQQDTAKPSDPRETKIRVVASIFPLADVTAAVGGRLVEVTTLLPAGQTPHGYEPNARQAETIARADLLIVVGLGMDSWAERSAQASGNKKLRTLVMADIRGMRDASDKAAETEHEDNHGGNEHRHAGDPHFWLDPVRMKLFVDAISRALGEIDPAHAEEYTSGAEAYRRELDALDAEYRKVLADVPQKAFVTFHEAFTYLADRYGLTQMALHDANVEDFGPRQLERVVGFMRDHHVKVIFAEPQFPAEQLQALTDQTGAVVGQLDPEGHPGIEGRDSYLALMRYNLVQLQKALSAP